MLLLRLLEINSLIPHYWSELMLLAFQLFDPKTPEYEQLQVMIEEVEWMVFTPDEINSGFSLYDIEMAMESNPDFFSFFVMDDNGNMITKFDIERELNKIKSWIYSKVREKAIGRKFQRFR
jgi:hypothetical protein